MGDYIGIPFERRRFAAAVLISVGLRARVQHIGSERQVAAFILLVNTLITRYIRKHEKRAMRTLAR